MSHNKKDPLVQELIRIESFRGQMKNYFGDRIFFEYNFFPDGEIKIKASLKNPEEESAFLLKQLVLSLEPEEAIQQIETQLLLGEGN